jgi:hypothetical protein
LCSSACLQNVYLNIVAVTGVAAATSRSGISRYRCWLAPGSNPGGRHGMAARMAKIENSIGEKASIKGVTSRRRGQKGKRRNIWRRRNGSAASEAASQNGENTAKSAKKGVKAETRRRRRRHQWREENQENKAKTIMTSAA